MSFSYIGCSGTANYREPPKVDPPSLSDGRSGTSLARTTRTVINFGRRQGLGQMLRAVTKSLRRKYGFHGHGLALHCSLHGDFLRRVFVEIRFVSFECVDVLACDERVLGSLLNAVAQAFRGGFVFHHVSLAAHGIAHDAG
jgi:hypothetical protein